jgi:hypothetical protein
MPYCRSMHHGDVLLRVLWANRANIILGALAGVALLVVLLAGGGNATSPQPIRTHPPNPGTAEFLPAIIPASCAHLAAEPACPSGFPDRSPTPVPVPSRR